MLKIQTCSIINHIDPDVKTVIMHGCNCFHTMGAGIAKLLSFVYPEILIADKKTSYGDRAKLGTILPVYIKTNLIIVNCYTQYFFGTKLSKAVPADYEAIRACLITTRDMFSGAEFRAPKMGCGHARGDWDVVRRIFEEVFVDEDLTIYVI